MKRWNWMTEEKKFDKYKEVIEGKTQIILENEGDTPDEEFELIVKNSEKMLIMNYFQVQDLAKKNYDLVPTNLTDEIETLFFNLFRRAYPNDDVKNIKSMIDNKFAELMISFMIGFKWATKEQLDEVKENIKAESKGTKKKESTP